MRINKEYIMSLNPCQSRLDNYLHFYSERDFSITEFLELENITYDDKIWVWKKFATINEAALFGLNCASSVLEIFESRYPNDQRPRLALEATFTYINDPSEVNKQNCKNAANAANAAANAAYAAAAAAADAADAAYAAAAADAADAAYAAADAADAAYAAYAAANAAYAAAAANTANADTKKTQQELNLIFLMEIYEGR